MESREGLVYYISGLLLSFGLNKYGQEMRQILGDSSMEDEDIALLE